MVRYFQTVPYDMYIPPVTHRNPCKWLQYLKKLVPGFCVLTCFDGGALPVTSGIARVTEESALLAGCLFLNWDDQITYSKSRVQHIKHVVSRQGGFATKCIQMLDPS